VNTGFRHTYIFQGINERTRFYIRETSVVLIQIKIGSRSAKGPGMALILTKSLTLIRPHLYGERSKE
jgi:hypothetical protein